VTHGVKMVNPAMIGPPALASIGGYVKLVILPVHVLM
jgi:hypothetical protein